jgi:glycosyltransferase involved in cell wall biosynthesis
MAHPFDNPPWVAVVVLGYKQAQYLPACLQSLEEQGLDGIQLIVVDNGSGDGSAQLMQAWADKHQAKTLLLPKNIGHCKAFNKALAEVKAPFVADLAADDVLLPNSLRMRVDALHAAPTAAFCHTNTVYIDDTGAPLGYEHPQDTPNPAWEGHVWQALFEGRFISPASVLFRTDLLKKAEGYDATLTFEDFDIWMRLCRKHPIIYLPQATVQYRQHEGSASFGQVYGRTQGFLESVLTICQKAYQLSKNDAERKVIGHFARYHLRLAAYTGNPQWVQRYWIWLGEINLPRPSLFVWTTLAALPLKGLYAYYHKSSKRKKLSI